MKKPRCLTALAKKQRARLFKKSNSFFSRRLDLLFPPQNQSSSRREAFIVIPRTGAVKQVLEVAGRPCKQQLLFLIQRTRSVEQLMIRRGILQRRELFCDSFSRYQGAGSTRRHQLWSFAISEKSHVNLERNGILPIIRRQPASRSELDDGPALY